MNKLYLVVCSALYCMPLVAMDAPLVKRKRAIPLNVRRLAGEGVEHPVVITVDKTLIPIIPLEVSFRLNQWKFSFFNCTTQKEVEVPLEFSPIIKRARLNMEPRETAPPQQRMSIKRPRTSEQPLPPVETPLVDEEISLNESANS